MVFNVFSVLTSEWAQDEARGGTKTVYKCSSSDSTPDGGWRCGYYAETGRESNGGKRVTDPE